MNKISKMDLGTALLRDVHHPMPRPSPVPSHQRAADYLVEESLANPPVLPGHSLGDQMLARGMDARYRSCPTDTRSDFFGSMKTIGVSNILAFFLIFALAIIIGVMVLKLHTLSIDIDMLRERLTMIRSK